ncbi:hypothetical protein AVEN_213533-1 [Araneus ventricosus]|uniref:Uncharacterized protein n=1 Tax=Araneus ventricosus TaxID=182803 RepID=A0A4Y2SQQ3_ARAVE|nr:hypothetical protein AVEN_213533-1 [Araneus ventricosus]
MPNVTVRTVLNGIVPLSPSTASRRPNVPFRTGQSRCPQAQLRGAQMSRFERDSLVVPKHSFGTPKCPVFPKHSFRAPKCTVFKKGAIHDNYFKQKGAKNQKIGR